MLLVRMETVPDDIHGMSVAQGILTATGGMTSHAAVVGRQMGKPSVVGCGALDIDAKAQDAEGRRARPLKEGDAISIDGTTGEVILKELPTSPSEVLQVVAGTLKPEKSPLYQKFEKLLSWADEVRRLGIRANADIPRDAKVAFAFGARGIGLCRTEHMFFAEDRLPHVVKMILSAARGQRGLDVTRAAEGAAGGGEGRARPPSSRRSWPGQEGVRQADRRLHGRAQEAAAHAARGLRRASSRRCTATRSPSAPSTRRCTSSCPSARS